MNKDRRKAIEEIKLKIEEIAGQIEHLKEEEEEYFDNMPEAIQYGQKGEAAQAAINNLDYAFSNLGDVVDYLDDSIVLELINKP